MENYLLHLCYHRRIKVKPSEHMDQTARSASPPTSITRYHAAQPSEAVYRYYKHKCRSSHSCSTKAELHRRSPETALCGAGQRGRSRSCTSRSRCTRSRPADRSNSSRPTSRRAIGSGSDGFSGRDADISVGIKCFH